MLLMQPEKFWNKYKRQKYLLSKSYDRKFAKKKYLYLNIFIYSFFEGGYQELATSTSKPLVPWVQKDANSLWILSAIHVSIPVWSCT